ncbi:MAG: (2Fe-2S) ferredoxin domain-containing protein [Actinomycetota bacterium]|nr:(2Fe-2S) ferredoxin domain-containing protein [Actinomycetota bacterium]
MDTPRQIFVCATPGEGRCGAKGGGELFERFREEVVSLGISPSAVLRNACTRRHEDGPVVFVFPDDVWYTHVTPEDVREIVQRHLARQTRVKN